MNHFHTPHFRRSIARKSLKGIKKERKPAAFVLLPGRRRINNSGCFPSAIYSFRSCFFRLRRLLFLSPASVCRLPERFCRFPSSLSAWNRQKLVFRPFLGARSCLFPPSGNIFCRRCI